MIHPAAPLHIGTSGWSYPHWRGRFYPERALGPGAQLAYYAARFSSVEVNTSFYHWPTRGRCAAWRRGVPANFVFAVKASRYLTHMKKLAVPAAEVKALLHALEPLGEQLGPVLFQLPGRWHANPARLSAFLSTLSRDFRYAFEFRDPSWWNAAIYELLARHRAAFCIYDLGGVTSPREVTADFVYVRLHGPNAPYRGSYGAHALIHWASTLLEWSVQGRAAYCYFDNDELGHAARNAGALARLTGRAPGARPGRVLAGADAASGPALSLRSAA